MKARWKTLLILSLLLNTAGCSFVEYAIRNTISEPVDCVQECVFRLKLRAIARATWDDICREHSGEYSHSYAHGFADGFVDFVDKGGDGEPPAMAPAHLRRQVLRSAEGQREIEDWFAGFRHGAAAAKESGLRERVVVPIGLPPRNPNEPQHMDKAPSIEAAPLQMQKAPSIEPAPLQMQKAPSIEAASLQMHKAPSIEVGTPRPLEPPIIEIQALHTNP